MYLFKYYRPDFFFDKAIRYNELYFSSTEQLNDPNDLKTSYFFEDDVGLWQRLLESDQFLEIAKLNVVLDLTDGNLANELCKIFLEVSMDGSIEQLESIFLKYDAEILSALDRHMKDLDLINIELLVGASDRRAKFVLLCKKGIIQRLLKGMRSGVYSVSFSTSALEPMMWAHYAAGFKGCVVIYHAPNDSVSLKRNIYSTNSEECITYEIDSVKYQNYEKRIPVLKSALGNDSAIRETLLVKNTFWVYEAEKRIFLTKAYLSSLYGMISNSIVKDPSDRIFHHEPSLIAGVIFGPGFDEGKKETIEFLLRDNRRHSPCDPFYLFDTELTNEGTIQIVKGKVFESSFHTGVTGKISSDNLPGVLLKLGIIKE